MDTIDVSGLSESVARQIQAMVEILREQLCEAPSDVKSTVKLPLWAGRVNDTLRREQIDDNVP